MLILTRRPGEAIMVYTKAEDRPKDSLDNSEDTHTATVEQKKITIRVLRMNGKQVTLAFDADRDVGIYREEVDNRRHSKNNGNTVDEGYSSGYASDSEESDYYY